MSKDNNEAFECYKKDIMSRPNSPYYFHNKDLAEAFFFWIEEFISDAVYFDLYGSQAICITHDAVFTLQAQLSDLMNNLKADVDCKLNRISFLESALAEIDRMGVAR